MGVFCTKKGESKVSQADPRNPHSTVEEKMARNETALAGLVRSTIRRHDLCDECNDCVWNHGRDTDFPCSVCDENAMGNKFHTDYACYREPQPLPAAPGGEG
jgi:hypothetical protein